MSENIESTSSLKVIHHKTLNLQDTFQHFFLCQQGKTKPFTIFVDSVVDLSHDILVAVYQKNIIPQPNTITENISEITIRIIYGDIKGFIIYNDSITPTEMLELYFFSNIMSNEFQDVMNEFKKITRDNTINDLVNS